MKKTITPPIATFAALMLFGLLGACNTTAGLGKDVTAMGDAVTDTAQDAKIY
jgi:predicted small secreted protein